jgi:hypothetical protein
MKGGAAMKNILRIAALVSLAGALACASGSAQKKPDSGGGFRVLDAVVVEREARGGGYQGGMIYSMGFEARDGEATAHMQFEVTKDQYSRFQEGAHVKLYLADNRLRDIKSGD